MNKLFKPKETRKSIIEKLHKAYLVEDRNEPYASRQYFEESNRLYELLKNGMGDFPDATDRATFDIVIDIFKYFGIEPY